MEKLATMHTGAIHRNQMAGYPQNAGRGRDMKNETPFTRWQWFIRIQQIRLAHALHLAGERREYGPQSRKEAAK
jgi:hypothetical protein